MFGDHAMVKAAQFSTGVLLIVYQNMLINEGTLLGVSKSYPNANRGSICKLKREHNFIAKQMMQVHPNSKRKRYNQIFFVFYTPELYVDK